jgi:hypothetical protein
MSRFNARREALAFRIWQYASAREWNVTLADIADGIGESIDRCRSTVVHRGWFPRIRSMSAGHLEANPTIGAHTSIHSGVRTVARHIAADLASGRIGNGESF